MPYLVFVVSRFVLFLLAGTNLEANILVPLSGLPEGQVRALPVRLTNLPLPAPPHRYFFVRCTHVPNLLARVSYSPRHDSLIAALLPDSLVLLVRPWIAIAASASAEGGIFLDNHSIGIFCLAVPPLQPGAISLPDPFRCPGPSVRRPGTFADLGCGLGAFSLVLLTLGLIPALALDFDSDAVEQFQLNFVSRFAVAQAPILLADLYDVTHWRLLLGVDMLACGFPCQPYSCAGCQRGLADGRDLLPTILTLAQYLRPICFLLENVASFLEDAEAFRLLSSAFADLGYSLYVDRRNASLYVPQHRDRIGFLVLRSDVVSNVPDGCLLFRAGLSPFPPPSFRCLLLLLLPAPLRLVGFFFRNLQLLLWFFLGWPSRPMNLLFTRPPHLTLTTRLPLIRGFWPPMLLPLKLFFAHAALPTPTRTFARSIPSPGIWSVPLTTSDSHHPRVRRTLDVPLLLALPVPLCFLALLSLFVHAAPRLLFSVGYAPASLPIAGPP